MGLSGHPFGQISLLSLDDQALRADHRSVAGMRRGAASLAVAAGLLLAAGPASGVNRPVQSTASPAAAAQARGLVVHIALSKARVRIGDQLRVDYSWSDGNGDLVDTNRIGTMAIQVLRNVTCTRTSTATHPIHGHGTWWYRPQAAFTGAYTHAVKIQVGYNVRTGGCAPVQEKTVTQTVTVLPAAD
jgi:hypothetical protein